MLAWPKNIKKADETEMALMIFGGFVLLTFLFLVLRLGVARYYKIRGKAELCFSYFIDTHHFQKIDDNALTDFLDHVQKKFGTPHAELYTFVRKEGQILVNFLPDLPEGPFLLPIDYIFPKYSIFLPKTWLNELREEEIKWLICHELGHATRFLREIALDLYCYLKGTIFRRHSQEYYNHLVHKKKERWADEFAAKVMGKQHSIDLIERMRKCLNHPVDSYIHAELDQHVSGIKDSIRRPENPLNLS